MYAFVPRLRVNLQWGTLPSLHGCSLRKGLPVSDQPSVVETLRVVRGLLSLARKAVIDARHIEAMIEIDTLMQIAQAEVDKRITILERAAGLSKR